MRNTLELTKRGNDISLKGGPLQAGRSISFGGGTLKLSPGPGSVHPTLEFWEGLGAEPRFRAELGQDGIFEVSEEGVEWQHEHPGNFYELLDVFNIPHGALHLMRGFSGDQPRENEDEWRAPKKAPLIRAIYRWRDTRRPMIRSIECLRGATKEDLAQFLTALLFGVPLGLDFFEARRGDLQKAIAWIKKNLFVEMVHPHYIGNGYRKYTCLTLRLRREKDSCDAIGRIPYEVSYTIYKGEESQRIGKAFHLLVEKHGCCNLLEPLIGDRNMLKDPRFGEYLLLQPEHAEYAAAWEDVGQAAGYITRHWHLAAVEAARSSGTWFIKSFKHAESAWHYDSEREWLTRVLEDEYRYHSPSDLSQVSCCIAVDDFLSPLLKKHGRPLVDLLFSSVPHECRLFAPHLYPWFTGLSNSDGILRGELPDQESPEFGWKPLYMDAKPSSEFRLVGLAGEFVALDSSALVGKSLCCSGDCGKALPEGSLVVGFLTDGAKGHVYGDGREKLDAVLWLPADERERQYYVVVLEPSPASHVKCKASVWGFLARRSKTGEVTYRTPESSPRTYYAGNGDGVQVYYR